MRKFLRTTPASSAANASAPSTSAAKTADGSRQPGRWLLGALALITLLAPALAHAQSRSLYLSGKVVLPDGSPPPVPADVLLTCGGRPRPQAETKPDGTFNFRVGGNSGQGRFDPRTPGREEIGQRLPTGAGGATGSHVSLFDCVVEARLDGYRSSSIQLGRRSVFESPEVGTIVLTPIVAGIGRFYSTTTAAAPSKARKTYRNAEKELAKEDPNLKSARKELEKAVKIDPAFAEAWNRLGRVRTRQGSLKEATFAFKKAAAADTGYVPPVLALTILNIEQDDMVEAAKYADRLVEMLEDSAEAHYYRALAKMSIGKFEAAEESARFVIASPDAAQHPKAHLILGNLLGAGGDIPAAAAEFQLFLEAAPSDPASEPIRQQLAAWKTDGRLK